LPPPAAAESTDSIWPLWTVYVAAVTSGGVILAGSVGASVARVPALAAVSTGLFGAFAAVCVWLLNRVHYFWPVGWRPKLLAALWGSFAAIGYALPANLAIYQRFAARQDTPAWSLFAPFTEEPMKDLGIVVVLLLAAPRPRTALDGLVVGSFVGLGFEVVENVVQSITNAIASAPPGHPGQWASLATDVIHEVLRRSWTGHIIITGIAGFGIAYAMTARHRRATQRWAVASGLVLLAFAGHLLWNSHRFGVFYVVGQFGLLGIYLWLIRVGRTQEARLYRPYLGYVAPSLVDPGIAESLGSAAARRAYRRASSMTRGRQRAVARLAAAIGNGDAGQAHQCAQRLASQS
jgi:RsiW-degrading membrane proteinase PrsW (M82 family)